MVGNDCLVQFFEKKNEERGKQYEDENIELGGGTEAISFLSQWDNNNNNGGDDDDKKWMPKYIY